MKGIVLAFLLSLPLVAKAQHEVQFTVELCEDDQCDCLPARSPTTHNLKRNTLLGCDCACGSDRGEECVEDDDCVFGLHCAAGELRSGSGQCKDACEKPGVNCGIFDTCVVNKENSEPKCVCKTFQCSDLIIGFGVCAKDEATGQKHVYDNDCLFENARCEKQTANLPKLKKLPISDCGEVIPETMVLGVSSLVVSVP